MSNEQNENFRVVEQRIPISERIAMAIAQFFATLALVFTATILLPVNFIRTLFTSKRQVIEVNAEATPLTQGGISDYLIQGKTGEILPKIV